MRRGLALAVIRPNANDTQALFSDYFCVPGLPPTVDTPLDAVRKASGPGSSVQYEVVGCSIGGPRASEVALRAAESAVKAAEATLLFLGLNQTQESETRDRDRASLALPGAQQQLLERVAAAAERASRWCSSC
mmetsp:Transcript_7763/g.20408  ORF Transcript_7763/g.20408 Transcript_7763/m.20408 type:complete len:133 (-) Transcript_7763:374-772(-)